MWSYSSSGNYQTVGTAVSKVKVRLKDVRLSDGVAVWSPLHEAALVPGAPPAGFVSVGTWSRTISWENVTGHRYYSKGWLYKTNQAGQHVQNPVDETGAEAH